MNNFGFAGWWSSLPTPVKGLHNMERRYNII
jgi:hypothetical protein